MALATLTIDINAKLANIERDLGKVAHLSEQSALRMQKAFAAASTAFAALGGGAIAGSLAAFVKASIDANAALDDLAEKTGATVESLSAISDIARIGGHDMATLEGGMVRLTKALAGGDDEAKAAGHALAALGLKADELRKLDTGTAMLKVAQALDKFGDSGGKTALVMDLLGKNGAALLPFLKDLAEKGELNAKVTTEQAAQAERLQKSWNQLKVYSDDLGRSLATAVVPALNDVMKNFNAAQEAGFGFFKSLSGIGVRGIGESISSAKENAAQSLRELTAERDRLAGKQFKWFEFGMTEYELQNRLTDINKRIAYYRTLQRQSVEDRFSGDQYLDARDLLARQKDSLSGYTSPDGKEPKEKKAGGGVDDYASRINAAVASAINGSDVVKAREYAAQVEALDKLFFDAGLDAEVYASALDKISGATSKASGEQDRLAKLLEATPMAKLEESRRDMLLLADALRAETISESTYLEAVQARLGMVDEKLKESKSLAEELGLTFTSAFEDAIVGGKKFSEVLNGLAQDVLRLVTRKNVTEPLANAVGSIDWSKLLSFNAAGGVYSGAGISAFSGQVVNRPTVFPFASGIGLMGEAGPEAILPLKRGSDGKLGVEGGGSSVVVNLIEAPGSGGQTRQRNEGGTRVLDVFVERIKASIAQDITDGRGAIPAAFSTTYGANRVAGAY